MEKKTYYKQIFFFIMGITTISFFLVLILTGGYSMRGLLSTDTEGTFMEFFDGVLVSLGNPYDNGVTISPLMLAIYRVFAFLIPSSSLTQIGWTKDQSTFTTDVKLYQSFWFILILYSVLFIAFLYFVITNEKRGKNIERIVFAALIFVSSPVLFILERGNSNLITLAFLLFFISFRNSENKLLKELGIISLAISAATNPLVILFSLLLANKGKLPDLLRFVVYFLVLFVSPVFLFGGIDSLLKYFTNVYDVFLENASNISDQLNFTNIIVFPLASASSEKLLLYGRISRIVLSSLSVIGLVLSRKDYQKAIFAACFAYGLSINCDTGAIVFLIVPILMLLNEEKEPKISAYGAISLLTLSVAPIVSMDINTKTFSRRFITLFSSFSIILLVIFLFITTVVDFILKTNTKEDKF